MVMRHQRALVLPSSLLKGRSQLTYSHFIVNLEYRLKNLFHPLVLCGFFVAFAWLGVFTALYPWLHLVGLTLFIIYFFQELGRAKAKWRAPHPSLAKRRVESVSGLRHRPLDVLEDRPVAMTEAQSALWQTHRARAEQQLQTLRWPEWLLNLSPLDPRGLRYALLALLLIGLVVGWGGLGARITNAVNPAIGKWHMVMPALDVWITPPETTHLPPIMIATPAGLRHDKEILTVPKGSVITAHLADMTGDVPVLTVNNTKQDFAAEEDKDYVASTVLTEGQSISISRGWQTLGSWRVNIVPDRPPHIAFADPPSVTEHKTIRVAVMADDDYGIAAVKLRVSPRESLPGYNNDPVEIPIGAPQSKNVKRESYEDLTASPWAGLPVILQLIATDTAGQESVSPPANFVLPERDFFHPIAKLLVEERRKLLQTPFDDGIRNEVANTMAGIAHQPSSFRNDPVVLMALRSGAVQLVLDHAHINTAAVNDLLWQTALRIEGGNTTSAENNLRQAQKDLADALDRNASERDIQRIIDRMHQAMAQYMAELAQRAAQQEPSEDIGQMLGAQNNVMSPDDLQRMIDNMGNLSAKGSRDAARQELSRMQQMLENFRTGPVALSAEQRAGLQHLKTLQAIIKDQKKLIDKTFQTSATGKNPALAGEQKDLLKRLRDVMPQMKGEQAQDFAHGSDAMQRAASQLQGGEPQAALGSENEALKALQEAARSMQEDLRRSLFMLPRPGQGMAGSDPLGREGNSFMNDDGSVKLPDQMEVRRVRQILDELQKRSGDMTRSKTERDYIDRLLQKF